MAISKGQQTKLITFGAVAGLATPVLMKYVAMPVLNLLGGIVPGISLKLANPTISVNVRESLTGIDGSLSGWLVDALGLSINVPFMTYIMAAIGGALLMLLGAYAADALGMLGGNAQKKTRTAVFIGSLLAGFIVGGMAVPEIGIDLVNTLIAFLVNAAIIAWGYVALDKQFKLNLIPF